MSQEDAVNPRKTPKITVVHDLLDLTAISYPTKSTVLRLTGTKCMIADAVRVVLICEAHYPYGALVSD